MKNSPESINSFFEKKEIAIAGISKDPKKFGNYLYKTLKNKGFTLYPLHPDLEEYDGINCLKTLSDLPSHVKRLLICTKPEYTEKIVSEANSLQIPYIWLQPGAESQKVKKYIEDNKMNVIYEECILLHLEKPGFPHSWHKFLKTLFGK